VAPVPFTIVQLTDLHIGAAWAPPPVPALAAAVDAIGATLSAVPDAVIVSGDVAHAGDDVEYEQARRELDRIGAPVYVLPGNHDDRDAIRRHFHVPPTEGDSINYVVDLGLVRLVALDTKRVGGDGGQLDPERLVWLDRVLAEDRATPTLLVMHHPPIDSGMTAMDAIGIAPSERRALAEIVSRHPQVQLIAAGHLHRTIVGAFAATPVVVIPGTCAQLALDFEADGIEIVPEPPCFAAHVLVDRRLVTHVQPFEAPA
jgi:3',5'-cyclic-AMP phosphodiesterase